MVKKNACVFISGFGSNLKSLIIKSREYNFPATIDDASSLDLIKSLRDKYILKKTEEVAVEEPKPVVEEEKKIEDEKKSAAASPTKKPSTPAKSPVKTPAKSPEKKNGSRPVSKEFEGKTADEIKEIKKERAAKRKKAFEERYEPR